MARGREMKRFIWKSCCDINNCLYRCFVFDSLCLAASVGIVCVCMRIRCVCMCVLYICAICFPLQRVNMLERERFCGRDRANHSFQPLQYYLIVCQVAKTSSISTHTHTRRAHHANIFYAKSRICNLYENRTLNKKTKTNSNILRLQYILCVCMLHMEFLLLLVATDRFIHILHMNGPRPKFHLPSVHSQ